MSHQANLQTVHSEQISSRNAIQGDKSNQTIQASRSIGNKKQLKYAPVSVLVTLGVVIWGIFHSFIILRFIRQPFKPRSYVLFFASIGWLVCRCRDTSLCRVELSVLHGCVSRGAIRQNHRWVLLKKCVLVKQITGSGSSLRWHDITSEWKRPFRCCFTCEYDQHSLCKLTEAWKRCHSWPPSKYLCVFIIFWWRVLLAEDPCKKLLYFGLWRPLVWLIVSQWWHEFFIRRNFRTLLRFSNRSGGWLLLSLFLSDGRDQTNEFCVCGLSFSPFVTQTKEWKNQKKEEWNTVQYM